MPCNFTTKSGGIWKRQVDDEEVRQALQSTQASGGPAALRDTILSGHGSPEDVERWGKSLLLYAAADPELRSYVNEAVDDALQSSAKDFGLSALIVLGAVLVILKYRPKKFEIGKDGIKIEWEENDVSVVADLAKAVSGAPVPEA